MSSYSQKQPKFLRRLLFISWRWVSWRHALRFLIVVVLFVGYVIAWRMGMGSLLILRVEKKEEKECEAIEYIGKE